MLATDPVVTITKTKTLTNVQTTDLIDFFLEVNRSTRIKEEHSVQRYKLNISHATRQVLSTCAVNTYDAQSGYLKKIIESFKENDKACHCKRQNLMVTPYTFDCTEK